MSLVGEKLYSGFPTRPGTNRAVQSQKMARCLKFRIYEVEGLCYLCSESKGTDIFACAKTVFLMTRLALYLY